MTRLEHAIDIVSHDISMAGHGLRPENLPKLKARLADLIKQRDAEFREWLRSQEAFQRNFRQPTITKPVPMFTAMTYDQYLAKDGTIKEDL